MATFAKLNSKNIVEQVISVHNNELLDNGVESEQKGIQFLKFLYGQDTNWKQTSYNTIGGKHYLSNGELSDTQNKAFRKNHAGIGYTYDEEMDAFIPPKREEYPSWILNKTTCLWEIPIPRPTTKLEENQYYFWNESIVNWEIKTK
jgi:hypothetical protein